MNELDNAHAFVDNFFVLLPKTVPDSASLKSSHDVIDSCLRLVYESAQRGLSQK